MWEAVIAIASVLGVLAGIIKMLLDQYFKKAADHENLKNTYQTTAIEGLKTAVAEHKMELKELGQKLERNTLANQNTQAKLQNVSDDLRSYIESVEKSVQDLHKHVLRLSDELVIVKGRPNGKSQTGNK